MTQNEQNRPTSRRLTTPMAATLLAVPVLATVGAFGIPALAATSAHGDTITRLNSVASADPQSAAAQPAAPQSAALQSAAPQPADARGAAIEAKKRALAHASAAASSAPSADDQALQAYFDHGYDYDDAVRLAKLWHASDVGAVKVGAGRNILAGRPLETRPSDLPTEQAATQAFLRAGYGYDDAVLLARLWGQGTSPTDAKARAGQKLLHGLQPPTKPGQTPSTVSEDAASEAFFDNGYSYEDAVSLAARWHESTSGGDLSRVKAEAGRKILAGVQLPVRH